MEAVVKIVGWIRALLLKEGTTLSRIKSNVLFPGGVEAGSLSVDQSQELERTELAVAGGGGEDGRGTHRT